MIKFVTEKWAKNKDKLEKYFKKTKQSEYNSYFALFKKTVELILNDGDYRKNEKTDEIINLDNDWQKEELDLTELKELNNKSLISKEGEIMSFIITYKSNEPDTLVKYSYDTIPRLETNNYFITNVQYGTCSSCDILKMIVSNRFYKYPNKKQVKDYMMLCLHMLQKMKRLDKCFSR